MALAYPKKHLGDSSANVSFIVPKRDPFLSRLWFNGVIITGLYYIVLLKILSRCSFCWCNQGGSKISQTSCQMQFQGRRAPCPHFASIGSHHTGASAERRSGSPGLKQVEHVGVSINGGSPRMFHCKPSKFWAPTLMVYNGTSYKTWWFRGNYHHSRENSIWRLYMT